MTEQVKKHTLTVREAAAVLGVSLPIMYEVTERADFNALIRIGKKKIILAHKLYEWMDKQTEKTAAL